MPRSAYQIRMEREHARQWPGWPLSAARQFGQGLPSSFPVPRHLGQIFSPVPTVPGGASSPSFGGSFFRAWRSFPLSLVNTSAGAEVAPAADLVFFARARQARIGYVAGRTATKSGLFARFADLKMLRRGPMRFFSFSRRPDLAVEVLGNEIWVRLPRTRLRVVYERTKDGKGLIARSFCGRKDENMRVKLTVPQFLASAWEEANAKARELGWIS
jgi:hypothetical protein